jgi:hypothetical protein
MTAADENARILLREITEALARGTKHYDASGKLLTTVKEIIECLLREGGVTFTPAEGAADDRR